ncbi:MAG: SRPBCC family protein [Armatimonadota bacterium]|nr:SRPBCC family protein [Armatimonadota bacterium]
MVKVEGRRIIRAPVQKVFQLVSRLDAQPRVTGLWLTADLLERRSNTLTVYYRGYFGGIPVESVQRAVLHPNRRIEFRQTRGGLRTFRGQYTLKSVDGDTELALTVEADVGIPLISEESARRVLRAFVERSLDKFKLTAERDLPRVTRKAQEPQNVSEEAVQPASDAGPAPAGPARAEPQPSPPQTAAPAASPQPQQARTTGGRRRRRRRSRRPAPPTQ